MKDIIYKYFIYQLFWQYVMWHIYGLRGKCIYHTFDRTNFTLPFSESLSTFWFTECFTEKQYFWDRNKIDTDVYNIDHFILIKQSIGTEVIISPIECVRPRLSKSKWLFAQIKFRHTGFLLRDILCLLKFYLWTFQELF